jgi:hypothetical protein
MSNISLRKFGYNTFMSDDMRHICLDRACDAVGTDRILRRLNEVKFYNKDTSRQNVFMNDIEYLTNKNIPNILNIPIEVNEPIERPVERPAEYDNMQTLVASINEFVPEILTGDETPIQIQAFAFRENILKMAILEKEREYKIRRQELMRKIDILQERVINFDINLDDFLKETTEIIQNA